MEIAGNKVVDYYRYIHVPEEWSRNERNRRNMRMIFRIIGWGIVVGIWLAGIVGAIISWSRKKFSVKVFLMFSVFLLALSIVGLLNRWPEIMAAFSTAQPLNNQILIAIIGAAIGAIGMSGAVGLVVGYIHIMRRRAGQGLRLSLVVGAGVGLAFAGLSAALNHFGPSPLPQWADYSPPGALLPLLSIALSPLNKIILNTAFMGLVFLGLDLLTAKWTRRKVVAVLVMLLLGIAITALHATDNIVFWLASGSVTGLLLLLFYTAVFRFQLSGLPFAVSALAILGLIKQAAMQAIPQAIPGAAIGIVAALLLAIFWAGQLEN